MLRRGVARVLHAALSLSLACIGTSACGSASQPTAPAPPITLVLLEADPHSPETLHANESVYVHVSYASSVPVHVWAMPYVSGKPARQYLSGGSVVHPAGEGEALVWFEIRGHGIVDEIHIQAAPEHSGYPTEELTVPVHFEWDGTPGAPRARAPWVATLSAQNEKLAREALSAAQQSPDIGGLASFAGPLFGMIALAALAACFLWPAWGLLKWRGKWRALASVPVLAVALWTLKICADVSSDSTSHNLLPFEYVILAVFAGPYMAIVSLLRRFALRREAET
jgi:hypothetical protein